MRTLVIDADTVEPFSRNGDGDIYTSQCVIEREGCGSEDLQISRYRLFAGKANEGGVHAENDETYYVLEGEALLTLGHPGSSQPAMTYALRPNMAVFIPAGTFHQLRNETEADFVILGIWPHQPAAGSNRIYDDRIAAWGTSFKLNGPAPRGVPVDSPTTVG